MFRFILSDTAVKSVSRQAHSPHKVPACDALGLPFPIELPEPRPIDLHGLSSCVLALCFGDLDALTLSLFKLFTLQLREGCEHGQTMCRKRKVIDTKPLEEPMKQWDKLTVQEKHDIAAAMIDVVLISDETGIEVKFSI